MDPTSECEEDVRPILRVLAGGLTVTSGMIRQKVT